MNHAVVFALVVVAALSGLGGYGVGSLKPEVVRYVDVPGPTEYVDVPGPTKYVTVPGPVRYVHEPKRRCLPVRRCDIADELNGAFLAGEKR